MPYYVVRDTNHPYDDLARNWSGFLGGSENGESSGQTEEEAYENYAAHLGIELAQVQATREFRFHPAHDAFVVVDFEGLGARALDSEDLESAMIEAAECPPNLAVCLGGGSGHFYAQECVNVHKVRDGRFIFELI